MPRFYSESNKPKSIPHPKTSHFQAQYQERLDKDGKTFLKKIDNVDVYDKIQQAKDGVLLSNLIEKYKIKINDIDLTKLEEVAIQDFTNMPESFVGAINVIDDAKLIWQQQPKEIKAFFNNNFNEFIAGAQNGTLLSLIKANKKTNLNEKVETTSEQVVVQEVQQTQNITQEQIKQEGVNLNV